MKALREAKAALANTVAMTHTADRLKTALAALVEAVEAAPVVEVARVHVGDHGPHVIYTSLPQGQRVRVLAVGEDG